jgi:prophage antirepressor-like protein
VTNRIIPFSFENHAVRVQVAEDGQSWFNANDVCAALDFSNSRQAVETHVDADDVQKMDAIDSMGRTQRANHVNESGLYALILGSTKAEAKRFKRWVTAEVLPAIRQSGSFGAQTTNVIPLPDTAVRDMLLVRDAVARVPGVNPGIAMSLALDAIESHTGLPVTTMRKALPGISAADAVKMNAGELGARFGVSARAINPILAELGLQAKDGKDWIMTEAGSKYGEMIPYTNRGHSGYQPLWHESVFDVLRERLGPPDAKKAA